MKKVFIGLLIAAAGTAVYFLTNNGSNPGKNSIQKDLIIGKWKLDSIYSLKDSVFNPIADSAGSPALHLGKYEYEFTTNGSIMLLPTDSSTIENRYEWIDKNQLAWKEHPENKTIEVFEVPVLKIDRMALVSNGSVVLSFKKAD